MTCSDSRSGGTVWRNTQQWIRSTSNGLVVGFVGGVEWRWLKRSGSSSSGSRSRVAVARVVVVATVVATVVEAVVEAVVVQW